MGIFIKRPFSLFCFCFIAASLLACALPSSLKLTALAALIICAIFFFAFFYKSKRKYGFIQTAVAIVFAALAIFESLIFIDFREKKLSELERESAYVDFVVTSKEYTSRYSSKYEGKIIAIDGKDVRASAYLWLDFEEDYFAGDRILLVGNVSRIEAEGDLFDFPLDTALEITPEIDKDLFIVSEYNGFDVSVLCGKLREGVREMLFSRLDKDSAALSLGVLTGDTDAIERQTVRDFRRAGLSHVLAVSGLHLAVILGAAEWLLRRLCVGKGKRCVTLTLLAFLLLMLSGFSLSACRAVLMLLCAYLCYMLSREPDTLTSLSAAGMLILLVSPLSVGSLSFWLSFLATLGIVLYSELFRTRRKRLGKAARLPFAKGILSALAVTLSANVFICIISWLCFGELSVISPLSNLSASPLCEAYLILTVIAALLGGLPFIGGALSFAANVLSAFIVRLVSFFSGLGFSVVSLEYPFAGIIICLAALSLAVLFIVKIRKKFILALIPAVSVALFCICVGIYNFADSHVRIAYINQGERDSLVVADSGRCVMIDVSDEAYSLLGGSYDWARGQAFTEIEAVVLTHYYAHHISSLDRLFGEAMVRSICLPEPTSLDELEVMKDIIHLASEGGVAVNLYESEEVFEVCEGTSIFKLQNGTCEGSEKKIIFFSLSTREGVLTYADGSWHNADTRDAAAHFISSSDALVLGAHGPEGKIDASFDKVMYPPLTVGANIDVLARAPHLSESTSKLLIAAGEDKMKICEFKFGGE